MIFFDNTIFKTTFEYQLSYILVPLALYLYIYFPLLRVNLEYHMVCIGIIGAIDSIIRFILKKTGILFTILSILSHLSLLFISFYLRNTGKKNVVSFILLILANIVIFFLPYWPYSLKRKTILFLYNFYTFIFTLLKIYVRTKYISKNNNSMTNYCKYHRDISAKVRFPWK